MNTLKAGTKIGKSLFAALVGCIALLGVAGKAVGHAISIGYENAGEPGAVTVWLGTYWSDGIRGASQEARRIIHVSSNQTYSASAGLFLIPRQ